MANPGTLSVYGTVRSISHWDDNCPHWRGHFSDPYGPPDRYYEFRSEGDAQNWFNTGDLPGDARELTLQEVHQGCGCRRR